MPISQKDFELISRKPINWPGSGNDGKSLAQRLDERTQPATGLTEDRVREMIAEAIQTQHPLTEVDPPPVEEQPDQLLLTEGGDRVLLTEAEPQSGG